MFWKNFEKLCTDRGRSPTAVVQELGLSSSAVTAWSRGSVPRNSTLGKIAKYFGVTLDALLADADDQKKSSPETVSGVETAQMLELIQLFDAAPPELRAAALAVLRSAEAQK